MTVIEGMLRIAAASAAAAMLASVAAAQEAAPSGQGGQDLSQAASDPTASVMSFQATWSHAAEFRVLNDETSDELQLRAAIPHHAFGHNNIFRITFPLVVDSPGADFGAADTTVFNLTTFNRSWGRFGVGAVALIPTGGSDRGAEKWGIGPALGFVNSSHRGLLWGVFNQNVFSFAGDDDRANVNISIAQPILNLSLGDGWSVGASEMNVTYDWEQDDFVSLPLGVGVSKLTRRFGPAIQFNLQYEHDFADEYIGPEDTISFRVKVLLPT